MEAASIGTGSPAKVQRSKGLQEKQLARLMVAPSMILIAVVAAWPVIYAIWLSLHEYSVRVAGLSRWAGFGNYSKRARQLGLVGGTGAHVDLHRGLGGARDR